MNSFGSRFVVLAASMAMLSPSTEALTVVAPSEGMTVVADRSYTVEYTGAGEDSTYEIDLHYCGSYSFCFEQEGDCGYYVHDLCGDDGLDCVQEDGSAEVPSMPEPIAGHSGNGYRIRITEVGSEESRCSDDFYLISSVDASTSGEVDGATISVVTPTADSMAVAGEEYTVEFDYDNGFGSRLGRFKIDLYAAGGSGDCGTWISSICDKPDKGCLDSAGDYNVVIPSSTTAGDYSIRVGLFGDDSVYACSDIFEIVASGEALWVDARLL